MSLRPPHVLPASALAGALLLSGALGAQPADSASAPPDTTAGPADSTPGRTAYPFEPPAFSPLEPSARVTVAAAERDTSSRLLILPDLGDRIGFWLHRSDADGWQLAGAVAGGVFSRFDLTRSDNELIEAHYRVALQLRGSWRGIAARAALYHVSSHLGDEFLERTGRAPISTSREGVELLVQGAPAGGLLLYGGPGLLLRSSADGGFEPASLRVGADWSPSEAASSPIVPYVAAEIFAWEELSWAPLLSAEAGIRIGPRARLAFLYASGPSRAEQFFREDERLLGLTFSFLH